MKVKIAICDDQSHFLSQLYEKIKKVLSSKRIEYNIDLFNCPKQLIDGEHLYDLVFLDIEIGQDSGIKVAEKIHQYNKNCLIFFITNHENYMDDALNQHAFRFWTKPINEQRLLYGIESAMNIINCHNKYIIVTVDKKPVSILLKDIIYIFSYNKITHIITTNGEKTTKIPFKDVKSKINVNYFCESHASYYVNLNYVKSYSYDDVICEYEGKIFNAYMSKRKYSNFKKEFIRWAGEQI